LGMLDLFFSFFKLFFFKFYHSTFISLAIRLCFLFIFLLYVVLWIFKMIQVVLGLFICYFLLDLFLQVFQFYHSTLYRLRINLFCFVLLGWDFFILGFMIFSDFLSIRQSWSYHLDHEFSGLAYVGTISF
jgi:hypothetical protein